jgi:protein ImuB
VPAGTPLRPVWLLAPPEPLPERGLLPLLDGRPLQLLSGPERIEAGWWDHELAERDYFIAQDGQGALLWLYRARLPSTDSSGWFLQGRFA